MCVQDPVVRGTPAAVSEGACWGTAIEPRSSVEVISARVSCGVAPRRRSALAADTTLLVSVASENCRGERVR